MGDTAQALYLVLLLAGPLFGYSWAIRRGRSRGQVVLAAACGGVVPGALLVTLTAASAVVDPSIPNLLVPPVAGVLVWPLITALIGAVLGVCGLLARALGAWLAQRP